MTIPYFVFLLFVSIILILIGGLVIFLNWGDFEFKIKGIFSKDYLGSYELTKGRFVLFTGFGTMMIGIVFLIISISMVFIVGFD
jgi:hypothetical protein